MSKPEKQRLSVCMIVKNEEEFLEDCLKSVIDVADEIRILDTGSTDRTLDIAKKYNAVIDTFEWVDDFSAARNASIADAKGDWILWLDADERLQPESQDKIRETIKPSTTPLICKIHIYNLMKSRDNYYISSAHRLFTNHHGIQFSGRIHEQISPSAARLKAKEIDCDIRLTHLGYGLEDEAQSGKNKRNRKLLEKMVRENPNNGYAHYTFAQHLMQTGELARAIKHFQQSKKLNQFDDEMKISLLNTMGDAYFMATDYDRAMKLAQQSIKLSQRQVAGYYLVYKILNQQNKVAEAIEALQQLMRKNEELGQSGKAISTDIVIDNSRLKYVLGTLLLRAGQFSTALEHFQSLYNKDLQNPDLLFHMAQCQLQLSQFNKAEIVLTQLADLKKHDFKILDMLAVVQIKLQKFQSAAANYESMLQLQPQNQQVLRRLAGLYLKTGDIQRAQALLSHSGSVPTN